MASLETLPPDQRAVLQLVLQRGRSYSEIAQLLSLDSGAVRERALSALAALGPGTRVPGERRAEISDYLLGQLPEAAAQRARDRIAASPAERAWARVVSSELAPLARDPLPEIPLEPVAGAPATAEAEAESRGTHRGEPTGSSPAAATAPGSAPPAAEPVSAGRTATPASPRQPPDPRVEPPPERPGSRRGGAILLGIGGALVAIVVVVVIVLALSGGSSKKVGATTTASANNAPTTAASATSTTSTATARPIAQVNLSSPTHDKKIAGVAEVIKQGTKTGLVIVAQGIPANSNHDAYAVWLYNSQSDNHILGFVNPGVKTDGKLQTAGPLPANAAHFKQLLVTLETQAKPHGPGKIVLKGPLSITQ